MRPNGIGKIEKSRAGKNAGKIPSVDGWRALSIALVLGAHSEKIHGYPHDNLLQTCLPVLFDGNLGVRFFFVISGFLITFLLIKEYERDGRISLKNFYIRRALRILPVYLAYLMVVAGLQLFTSLHQKPMTWLGDLTFTTNFLPRGIISGHLWSLAVEQQFYLLWPITFLWLKKNSRFTPLVLIAPVLVAMLCHFISLMEMAPWILHPLFHFHSSLVNFDSLAVGCMAAFLFAMHHDRMARLLVGGKQALAAALGACLVLLPSLNLPYCYPIFCIVGNFLQAVGFAILRLTSIFHPNSFRPLNWQWVIQIGVVSYSIYIWQQIVYAGPETYGFASYWWMTFPWWIAVVLLAGLASFYGFERPLLRLRKHYRGNSV